MGEQRRIALFVDVAGLQLNIDHINNLFSRLEMDGDVVYAKFYGAAEAKYKKIAGIADARGFDICAAAKNKKKGVFDARILVDVMEAVFTNKAIDTVAVVSCPADFVYLFSKLKQQNIGILSVDFLDEESLRFVSQVLYFGYSGSAASTKARAEKSPAAAFTPPRRPIPGFKPAPASPKKPAADNTELEILRDINKLKRSVTFDDDTTVVDQLTAILENFKELDT